MSSHACTRLIKNIYCRKRYIQLFQKDKKNVLLIDSFKDNTYEDTYRTYRYLVKDNLDAQSLIKNIENGFCFRCSNIKKCQILKYW